MNPAHYDYDALADLAEGLLEADQAASVNAHLDTCAECRDRSADLADVSRILAEAPVPSMPAELAERIDTAIAAESMSNAPVVSLEQRRGRRHWRILSAAAATVVVLGGGALVGKAALNGSGDNDHSATAHSPVTDRKDSSGGSAQAPSERTQTLDQNTRSKAANGSYTVSHSGTEYRQGQLNRQVGELFGKGAELKVGGGRAPDAQLAQCVTTITGGKTPDLVDVAKYEGSDATVIALPGAKPGTWSVWAVGPNCSILKREPA
ncbi:anti-sigma factor family protein [Spirillospora sp. NPDC048911]|uniref:anti-sigma factor family protein n=1 Tax=Spirillospora sp. NPDC048911 TaxID=3364527 RepID=UPI003718B01C